MTEIRGAPPRVGEAGPPAVSTLVTNVRRNSLTGSRTAVLIDAGHASSGGAPGSDRILYIGDGLEVGRAPTGPNAWALQDRRVSTRHARIERQQASHMLVDLGSTNGTLLDGQPVSAPVPLQSGAVIFFGGQAAVFRLISAEEETAIEDELRSPLGPVGSAAPCMAVALGRLRRLARTTEGVLITGETGVGKEVYARAVHQASGRTGPFVAINCAALPPELLESELFGYLRGAHSQASQAKVGLIEQAERGTLLLDEIGDLPELSQAKLLRFLQTGEFYPLGGTTARRVDVRVIAATNRWQPSDSTLRPDLVARLGADPVCLPPLRRRPEDLGPVAAHLLSGEGSSCLFESAAFLAMLLHRWPMNVRELARTLREARAAAPDSPTLALQQLPASLLARLESSDGDRPSSTSSEPPPGARLPRPSRELLESLLTKHRGNVAAVARELGRQQAVIWRTLDRYGLEAERFRV